MPAFLLSYLALGKQVVRAFPPEHGQLRPPTSSWEANPNALSTPTHSSLHNLFSPKNIVRNQSNHLSHGHSRHLKQTLERSFNLFVS